MVAGDAVAGAERAELEGGLLAGGVDGKYDVDKWQEIFERSK